MPDEPFLGEIAYFSYNFAPRNWLPCDGRLMPINQNQALFSLLGTAYGGNGTTTFALPDLIARSAVGTGMGPGLDSINLGQQGGQNAVTLTPAQMPPHNHLIACSDVSASDSPSGLVPGVGNNAAISAAFNCYGHPDNVTVMPAAAVAPAGGNAPLTTRSPYLGLQPCICTSGIYPQRS